jgi:hypothetical protein
LGPGLVIQTLGHGDRNRSRAEDLLTLGGEAGILSRLDHIDTAEQARARLACPDAMSCVALEGELVGNSDWSVMQLWQEIRRRKRL